MNSRHQIYDRFKALLKQCNTSKNLYKNEYNEKCNKVYFKRAIRYNFKYIINLFNNVDLHSKIIDTMIHYDSDKEKYGELNNTLLAYVSMMKVFNRLPISYLENLEICSTHSIDPIGLIFKNDDSYAMNNCNEIIDYIDSIEDMVIGLRDLYIIADKNHNDYNNAIRDNIVMFIDFLTNEFDYISSLLYAGVNNKNTDPIIENYILEHLNLKYKISMINEEFKLSTALASFKEMIKNIIGMVTNSGIKHSESSKKSNEWKNKYTDQLNDKVVFNDKENNNGLALTYYDKDAKYSGELIKLLENFYSSKATFEEMSDVNNLLSNIDEILKKDEDNKDRLDRGKILEIMNIKDDNNKSISSLLITEFKSLTEKISNDNLTNGELIDLYSKTNELLKNIEKLNDTANNYVNSYENKIKTLSNQVENRAKQVDTDKSDEKQINTNMMDSNNTENKETTDPNKQEDKKEESEKKEEKQSDNNEVVEKMNKLTSSYIGSMNLVVAVTQVVYTVVYTTINEIDIYFSKLPIKSSEDNKSESDVTTKETDNVNFNSKDSIL